MNDLCEVKEITIADGVKYSGYAIFNGSTYVPNGMGIIKYSDHNVSGMYNDGKIHGVAYRNYHEWMNAGYVFNEKMQGWGMSIKDHEFKFGVWRDDKFKISLTPLVKIVYLAIMEESSYHNYSIAFTNRETSEFFFGISDRYAPQRFGFHFTKTGDVYVGWTEYGEGTNITGAFYHFDTDYNIQLGKYINGVLVENIDLLTFVKGPATTLNAGKWDLYAFYSFNINMNYSIENFDLDKPTAYVIIDQVETTDAFIVRANKGKIVDNTLQASTVISEHTIWFSFPKVPYILDKLKSIDDIPWVPDVNDFTVNFACNIDRHNRHIIMYRHKSFESADYNKILNLWDISAIKNRILKENGL